jgi:GT2 family glycosyltransferase
VTSPSGPARVSVAILSWNGRRHLETCLAALAEQHDPGVAWEVLVLDNGSTDGTADWLRERYPPAATAPQCEAPGGCSAAARPVLGGEGQGEPGGPAARRPPCVRWLASAVNLGFCAGNNRLVAEAAGDLVAFLNNDTRPGRGWLAALVAALAAAPADVAAVSGQIVDWAGERLDFGRGVMTFDGHAFQLDFRRPLAAARLPASGEELLFACGGNMLVRKASFLAAGGFDESYFAYLEDVDLGWRLWSGGERILFAPEAVVHHRSNATSDLLGLYNRGFLFERNAFLTAYKNYEAGLWEQVMPALLLTFLSRTQTMLADNNPGGGSLRIDPYAGWIANTAGPGTGAAGAGVGGVPEVKTGTGTAPGTGTATGGATARTGALAGTGPADRASAAGIRPASGAMPPAGSERKRGRQATADSSIATIDTAFSLAGLARRWRDYGPWELCRRAVRKLLTGSGDRRPAPPRAPLLTDERTVAQLRALSYLLSHLEAAAAARAAVQRRRRRSDREIFARFPLYLVPTYPGDEALFESLGFAAWLPESLPLVRRTLDEMMELEEPRG